MATVNSVEYANEVAVPVVKNLITYKSNHVGSLNFTLNTTATPVSNGDTINLGKLPAGAKILPSSVCFGAMGASATLSIGYAGATTHYLSALDVSAAGKGTFADTIALNNQDVLTAETLIIATAGGANFASAKALQGTIKYVVD